MTTSQKSKKAASVEALYKKELEDFLYLVSHDLNAPLRHIREFSRLLLKRLEAHIGEEEEQYVALLERAIAKSERMLGALQDYSHLTSRAERWEKFDLGILIEDVFDQYRGQIQEHGIELETDGLPGDYIADRAQIAVLYGALVDNSIKFRCSNTAPYISITCERADDFYYFRFEDNGQGVEAEYTDRIFEMFKRGAVAKTVPGIGAGLAFVQKIVRRHGGEIHVDASHDKGLALQWSHPPLKAGASTVYMKED